jgi:hypothetical protein
MEAGMGVNSGRMDRLSMTACKAAGERRRAAPQEVLGRATYSSTLEMTNEKSGGRDAVLIGPTS